MRKISATAQPDFSVIAELLESKYWTWAEFARQSGISIATVLSLRAGRRRASYQTIRKIAAALEVEPGEIVLKEGEV